MNEFRRRTIVKKCIEEYYSSDKKILVDPEIFYVVSSIYIIYNLIFFSNKIMITKENYEKVEKIAQKNDDTIVCNNAKYFLENVDRDEHDNYMILDLSDFGTDEKSQVYNYLIEDSNVVYYSRKNSFTHALVYKYQLDKQVKILEKGIEEISPFEDKRFKFETIGAIGFKDGNMFLKPQKENQLIRLYGPSGKLRKTTQVKVGDFVLIRGDKREKYSFNLYEIVSNHTRNFACKIVWTDLYKVETTNKYIEDLNYKYKNMILSNI